MGEPENLFEFLTLSKKDRLALYLKGKEFFRTSDVIRWGSDNYCNRSDRYKREYISSGLARELTDEEKVFRGFRNIDGKPTRESVYQWIRYTK